MICSLRAVVVRFSLFVVTGDIDGSGMIDARWCGAHHPAKTLGVCERVCRVVACEFVSRLDGMLDGRLCACVCVVCADATGVSVKVL